MADDGDGEAPPAPRRASRADKRRETPTGGGEGGTPSGEAKRAPPRASRRDKKHGNGAEQGEPDVDGAEAENPRPRVSHWTECAWFQGGAGDLAFAQWMLGRCSGVGDTRTPSSRDSAERVHALYLVQQRLRLELALSTSAVAVTEDHDTGSDAEETEDVEAAAQGGEGAWPVAAIVEEVGIALRPARLALARARAAALRSSTKFEGGLERIVVGEVVEYATELLLSHATGADGARELEKWLALLSEDVDTVVAEEFGAPEGDRDDEDTASTTSKRSKKKDKKRERTKGKDAEKTACEQTRAFLEFLSDFGAKPLEAAPLAPWTAEMAAAATVWTQELQQIYDDCRIDAADEARRLKVARDIQEVLRTHVSKWRHCEVVLFGSSRSHFGSKHSDMDMCLIPKPSFPGANRSDGEAVITKQAVSSRQIRQLIKAGHTTEGGETKDGEQIVSIEALLDLDDHAAKSIEKLTLTLNNLDNEAEKSKTAEGLAKKKGNKQRKQLEFFLDHWQHLSRAIRHDLDALKAAGGAESVAAYKVAAAERQAHLKSLITASRKRNDDMYLLQGMLQRAKCTIRMMIRGARIPIIRFTHNPTGLECDLCFENVLATRNTLLLRAYAEFDERARVLGLAIKHWAKQRGVSDASMGFFSSYTFVLLAIYFLQQESVGVLPNLQHPELLERLNQPRRMHNGVDISFCTDVALARAFHQQRQTKSGASSMTNASAAELLAGLFRFYASSFDFARNVVAVRSPGVLSSKVAKWGPRKAKTWRMSVEDPLETTRDLGCVLQFKGQEAILREFRRADALLTEGSSFATVVCAPAAAAVSPTATPAAAAAAAAAAGGKRGSGKPEERPYMVTLWSADRELTKPGIVGLFKHFEASFRVGKILEARDGHIHTGRKWEVELRTKALQCPRALHQRTRIDWEEVEAKHSNGKAYSKQRLATGSVWIQHTELHKNAPCTKCFAPQHVERDCQEEGGEANQNRHVLRVTISGAMTRGSSTGSNNQQQKEKRASARQVSRWEADADEDQEDEEDEGGHADRGESRPNRKPAAASGSSNGIGSNRNRERRRNKDVADVNNGEHSARKKKPKTVGDRTVILAPDGPQSKRNQSKDAGNGVEDAKDGKKKKKRWVRSGGDGASKAKGRAGSAATLKPAVAS